MTRKLWGGRFSAPPAHVAEALNNSLPFDGRLWPYDIRASVAHARMLGATGIVTPGESETLCSALIAIAHDLAGGAVELPVDAEDVHSAVEALLHERAGPVAGKLHTARSRNDQVATDLRLFTMDAANHAVGELRALQRIIAQRASEHVDTILPGLTHLQHAQPVLLAHHLLAYFWMLERDISRFDAAQRSAAVLALGSAALAGTGFPLDREMVAKELGIGVVAPNSMDAVSDRDFALDFLSASTALALHLTRLAEELVIWSTPEFGFVDLADSVTTGSSIMPQKRNPDVAELCRAKSGRIIGDYVTLVTVLKGLPLAYNKDMQEDKEPVFDAADTVGLVLPAMRLMLETARFNVDRMRAATTGDFSTATELADFLAREGIPFREAHDAVGRIVRQCETEHMTLEDVTPELLTRLTPLDIDVANRAAATLRPDAAVQARCSYGGTARAAVMDQLSEVQAILANYSRNDGEVHVSEANDV